MIPATKFLDLVAAPLVEQLRRASDWLAQLDRVELEANEPDRVAGDRLMRWLASDKALRHVRWQRPVRVR